MRGNRFSKTVGLENENTELSPALRTMSAKLRSIAYLIENHRDEVGEPFDIDEIYWGLGMILTEISNEMKTISISEEDKEVKAQRKKS